MEEIKIGGILAFICMAIAKVKVVIAWAVDKWAKLSPMIKPIIESVEKAAVDKKIDLPERKKIAMDAIANAEKQGLIKLNPLTRWVIGKIVDRVAQKLPDIDVAREAPQLVAEAIKEVNG